MKVQGNTTLVSSNLDNTSGFEIKASAKAFKILSDGLYSNKILAVVRELGCNALDSHNDAGVNDRPIEVTLPRELSNNFSIEDFGLGMTADEVYSLYTTYFSSNKTETNDLVGGFGLGSKSPFSYTDSFNITATKNGERNHFVCFIGEDGVPQVSLLKSEKTGDRNGLKVSLAVNDDDRWDFEKTCDRMFSTFPKGSILINGKEPDHFTDEYTADEVNDGVYVKDIGRYGESKFFAKMGPVLYPISSKYIEEVLVRAFHQPRKFHYIIEFPIGSLDITGSREELSYDKTTVDNITNRLCEIRDSYNIESMIKAHTCVLDIIKDVNLINNLFIAHSVAEYIKNDENLSKYITFDYNGVLKLRIVKTEFQISVRSEYDNKFKPKQNHIPSIRKNAVVYIGTSEVTNWGGRIRAIESKNLGNVSYFKVHGHLALQDDGTFKSISADENLKTLKMHLINMYGKSNIKYISKVKPQKPEKKDKAERVIQYTYNGYYRDSIWSDEIDENYVYIEYDDAFFLPELKDICSFMNLSFYLIKKVNSSHIKKKCKSATEYLTDWLNANKITIDTLPIGYSGEDIIDGGFSKVSEFIIKHGNEYPLWLDIVNKVTSLTEEQRTYIKTFKKMKRILGESVDISDYVCYNSEVDIDKLSVAVKLHADNQYLKSELDQIKKYVDFDYKEYEANA